MRLKNYTSGDAFEFIVTGYEHPRFSDKQPDRHEINWLNITVKVRSNQEAWKESEWTKSSPCLLTWELQNLRQWFAAIQAKQPVEGVIKFLESDLKFSLIKGNPDSVRIAFGRGLHPEWAAQDDLWIEFELSPQNLKTIIDALMNK